MQGFFLAEGHTVTGGGGGVSISIAYIIQSFHKFICLSVVQSYPPVNAALCKLCLETLHISAF